MKKTTKRILGLLFGIAVLFSMPIMALADYTHFESGIVSEEGYYVGASGTETEVIDADGNITLGTLTIGDTEVTATADEINYLADVAAGTSAASKAVVLGSDSKIDALDITALKLGGTLVTSTAADINTLTGVASQFIVYQVIDLAADADITSTGLFVCPAGFTFTISSIDIISQGTAAGIDDSNTCVISVLNGTNAIVTKIYNTGTTFPADGTSDNLGALDETHKVITAGQIIKYTITNGATADSPAFIIQIIGELATVE